jgi:anaerobic magnesium-protoporphyrin IX monomethyl ester cyclase
MEKITLVNVAVSDPATVPTGPLYIASALIKAGYGVDFRDCAVRSYADLDPDELAGPLADSSRLVGVSCLSDSLPVVVAALKRLKTIEPGKVVILGGAGPTGVASELLTSFDFIDVVVIGEGERTIVEAVECLTQGDRHDLGLVNGLCYRDGDHVLKTPPRERIEDLDEIGFPHYESAPMEKYPFVNLVFSRGCPYHCTFCDVAPMWARKNRRRSVDSMTDEIRLLTERYGKTDFEFTDETFVLNRDSVSEFCERLRSDGLNIEWACTGRVNLVSRDLLADMSSAGCKGMFYGIESGSDAVLQLINKDFDVREALDVVRTTAEHMRAVASFIWGFPFETEQDLVKTLLFMVYLSQIGVDTRLNRLAPFALAPLYEQYRDRMSWFDEPGPFPSTQPFRTQFFGADVAGLVRDFPAVFPGFYWFPVDELAERSELVRSLQRYWQVAL